jgi:MoaA/NifB/PqqE/SkfB family radical SAM enzyme
MKHLSDIKNYLQAKGISSLLPRISSSPRILTAVIERFKDHAIELTMKTVQGGEDARRKRREGINSLFEMAKRTLPRLSKETRKKFALNLFFNEMHLGSKARNAYLAKYGETPPFFITISPSMRCNLSCYGCYAGDYDKTKELTFEEVDCVVQECKDVFGIYFIVISGGEPTIWPRLFDIVQKHSDVMFQMYTHGMNIDEAMAKKLAKIGNLYPAISIEGDEANTNARRGPDAWRKITDAMCRLRDNGALFGFSATHTRSNHDALMNEEFYDKMIDCGCAFGWIFQYILTGRNPAPELVPTAQQRIQRYDTVEKIRRTRPLLVFDFWNDGEFTEGCIAWGRRYLHVQATGYVEPCVFVHFAKDNIREKTLLEIVNSECFKEARKLHPFSDDHRRPCSLIDNREILPYLVEKYNMVPTHDGAERIITTLRDTVVKTSEEYEQALKEARHEPVAK